MAGSASASIGMTLRLRDTGIATAYATVGVGDVEAEMRNAGDAAKRLRADRKKAATISEPETIFLLGQADIASIYETSNFMRVFDLRYPRAESSASVVNWVFSVPYDVGRRAPPPPGHFRFLLHVRFRRSVYAFREVEQMVFDKLYELLGGHAKDARFHAGLGWSDLIIDGTFTPRTFEAFAQFIIEVHGLQIRFGPERRTIPVVQRMLTLLGYTGEPPAFANNSHLTFLRAQPGRYGDVLRLLAGDGGNRTYTLDGKADFMIASRKTTSRWLAKQRELGREKNRDKLRKVETHLMFFPARKFLRAAEDDRLFIDADEIFDRDRCGCGEASQALVAEIDETMNNLGALLRSGQRHAIDNTLFLLASALRDASICCDAADAVLASFEGLLIILRSLARLKQTIPDPAEQYKYTVSLWARLDDWHRFGELLLRQRTVGSYEEILGQSDRSVVYSGGVQKFLYLADQLVAEFATRLNPANPPKFATIYDSVKTIFSHRIGVVRVPTSKMFSFPHVVADLWHEVAGTLFFLRKGRDVARFAPLEQGQVFLERLADHYADVQVYLYGFGGDFERFLTSLAHGWKATYGDVDEVVQRWSVGEFLLRTYLIYEFHELRRVQSDLRAAEAFRDPEKSQELVGNLQRALKEKFDSIPLHPEDWLLLRRNVVKPDFSSFHRNLYQEFLTVPARQPVSTDLRPFLRGEVTALDHPDDLNDLFGELSHALASRKTGAFRAMAALGKSAAIEYHRRQVLRRVKCELPQREPEPAPDPDATAPMETDRQRKRRASVERYKFGDVVAGYRIERFIASGSMGDVYAATNSNLPGERIALKVAKTGASNDDLERMIEEVRLGRSVRHPNVCGIHNVVRTRDGRLAIEMDFIEGENLASEISRMAPAHPTRGSRIAAALFAGLEAIHGAEPPIIHRDLKPANVMLDSKGMVRIMDFGLAIRTSSRQRHWAGTRLYMAPEVVALHPATTASDIYSAGLVLLELFTGLPMEELRAAHSKRGTWETVPAVLALPKRARELILSCLEDQPAKRPTSSKMRNAWDAVVRRQRRA